MIKYCLICEEEHEFNTKNEWDCLRCENCLNLYYSEVGECVKAYRKRYQEEKKHLIDVKNNIDEKKINEITEALYCVYGSGTGVLFGIPINLKSSVRAIVKVILTIKTK